MNDQPFIGGFPFGDDTPPMEAPAHIRQLAQSQWEVFNAFTSVGFTRDEAIQLTSTFLGATIMLGNLGESDGA